MPLNISKIRALCFDVDGTLRDTDDHYVNLFARLLKPARFLLPEKDEAAFARRVVMSIETPGNFIFGLPDRFGIDDELAAISDFLHRKKILKEKSHKGLLMINGVKEMLETLAAHYPLAVVTARGRRGTMAFLDHFKLTQYFQYIATAQTARFTKPKPDPILWAAAQMQVSPSECLMIGDTSVDIKAGKAAGAQTVGVLCGFGVEGVLRKKGADEILPQLLG